MIFLNYNSRGFQYKPVIAKSNPLPVEKAMIGNGIYQVGRGIESIKFKNKKPSNNIKFIL